MGSLYHHHLISDDTRSLEIEQYKEVYKNLISSNNVTLESPKKERNVTATNDFRLSFTHKTESERDKCC